MAANHGVDNRLLINRISTILKKLISSKVIIRIQQLLIFLKSINLLAKNKYQ